MTNPKNEELMWGIALPAVLLCAAALGGTVAAQGGGNGGRPGGESFGNNLSFPVIWAEGVAKSLRGTEGTVTLNGPWWWWWGTDAAENPLSCAPDPDDPLRCDDGIPLQATGPLPGAGAIRAHLQQQPDNEWRAASVSAPALPAIQRQVHVDWIDWGDSLESVNWNLRSQVRTEVVLIEDLATPDLYPQVAWEPNPGLLQYGMRHLYGWGINEMHGLAIVDGMAEALVNTEATVYSHRARLTIQRLLVERGDPRLDSLTWVPGTGWTETTVPNLVNAPIFDGAVWEGGDGPGYYSAEINVKGKVIYGYTWNVRNNNEGAGDYRMTFSLEDDGNGGLNTYFVPNQTQIVPLVSEGEAEATADEGGAVAQLDFRFAPHSLTYIDVRIEATSGGGGGGSGGKNKKR